MPRHPNAPPERASLSSVWSWLGFAMGLLLYVTLSEVFELVPKDDLARGLWFSLGLVPGFVGFCIGFAHADRRDDADQPGQLRSST